MLGLEPHPDKTWVGLAEQGVDLLGYRICPKGITVAEATITRGVTRLHRLQKQQGRNLQQTAALDTSETMLKIGARLPQEAQRGRPARPQQAKWRGILRAVC